MRYLWDEAKDALNRQKHRLSLADGIPALEDPDREVWIDDRFDYGEERFITLSLNQHRVFFVVTAEAEEDCTRIISVRRAEAHEIERYAWHRS
jgi:uncharacterized DUF497 family protein